MEDCKCVLSNDWNWAVIHPHLQYARARSRHGSQYGYVGRDAGGGDGNLYFTENIRCNSSIWAGFLYHWATPHSVSKTRTVSTEWAMSAARLSELYTYRRWITALVTSANCSRRPTPQPKRAIIISLAYAGFILGVEGDVNRRISFFKLYLSRSLKSRLKCIVKLSQKIYVQKLLQTRRQHVAKSLTWLKRITI